MAGDLDLTEKAEGPPSRQSQTQSEETQTERASTEKKNVEKTAVKLASGSEKNGSSKPTSNVVTVGEKEHDIYSHLPPHEAAILRRQVDLPILKNGWKTLYRYATTWDFIIIGVSTVCTIAAGAALPLMTVIFGQLAGEFSSFFNKTISHSDFSHTITHMVLYFIYIGIAEFITIYVSTVGFIYTGEHISGKIREQYLAAVRIWKRPFLSCEKSALDPAFACHNNTNSASSVCARILVSLTSWVLEKLQPESLRIRTWCKMVYPKK